MSIQRLASSLFGSKDMAKKNKILTKLKKYDLPKFGKFLFSRNLASDLARELYKSFKDAESLVD